MHRGVIAAMYVCLRNFNALLMPLKQLYFKLKGILELLMNQESVEK